MKYIKKFNEEEEYAEELPLEDKDARLNKILENCKNDYIAAKRYYDIAAQYTTQNTTIEDVLKNIEVYKAKSDEYDGKSNSISKREDFYTDEISDYQDKNGYSINHIITEIEKYKNGLYFLYLDMKDLYIIMENFVDLVEKINEGYESSEHRPKRLFDLKNVSTSI